MKHYPSVDAFLNEATTWKAELELLRQIFLDCGLTEEVKWGQPCYSFEGNNIVIMGELKDSCSVGFFKGVLLKDPKGILDAPGPNSQSARVLRIRGVAQVKKLTPTIKAYVMEAVRNEEQGVQVAKKTTHRIHHTG